MREGRDETFRPAEWAGKRRFTAARKGGRQSSRANKCAFGAAELDSSNQDGKARMGMKGIAIQQTEMTEAAHQNQMPPRPQEEEACR